MDKGLGYLLKRFFGYAILGILFNVWVIGHSPIKSFVWGILLAFSLSLMNMLFFDRQGDEILDAEIQKIKKSEAVLKKEFSQPSRSTALNSGAPAESRPVINRSWAYQFLFFLILWSLPPLLTGKAFITAVGFGIVFSAITTILEHCLYKTEQPKIIK